MKNIKHLLPISTNENGTQVVSMRDLYDWLEAKAEFTTWAKRMFNYGFTKNVDFAVIDKIVKDDTGFGGHRKLKDFALTLDTAKEIAMIQRNERGKQARQYFIAAEKQLQSARQAELPQSPEDQLALTMQVANRTVKRVAKVESDVSKLQNTMRINGNQEKALLDIHHKSAFKALGGKESNAYKNDKLRNKTFRSVWSEFKKAFYLPRYGELQQTKFDDGKEFLEAWKPNTELRLEIKKANKQNKLF